MVDTIVIGGGIVGAAVAFHLVHHGVSVRLICRHDQQRATDAGAGIMTPHTTRASDRWLYFAMEAFDHYQQLAQLLHKDVDQIPVARDGRLVGVVTRANVLRALYERNLAALAGRQPS